jgi:hypothetical protein
MIRRVLRWVWPAKAVASRGSDGTQSYIRSYVSMRFAVGLLGVALPLIIVLLEPLLFDGQPFPRGSLSAYYYSGVRELFVGMLCAIGVFLIIYKLGEPTREGRLSTFAGIAVILVAFFPTGLPGARVRATPLQDLLGEEWVERIHFSAAGLFIFLLWRITRDYAQNDIRWRRFHATCAWVILGALVLAAFSGITGEPDKALLLAECVAVMAFGASWLRKVEWSIVFGKAPAPAPAPTAEAPTVPSVPTGT